MCRTVLLEHMRQLIVLLVCCISGSISATTLAAEVNQIGMKLKKIHPGTD